MNGVDDASPAESIILAVEAWRIYVGHLAGREILELPGLSVVWGDAEHAFYNAVFLAQGPMRGALDLARDAGRAAAYMKSKTRAGLFVVSDEQCLGAIPDELGFRADFRLTGMVTEVMVPTQRIAPTLEFRRVDDTDTARAISDINSRAYGSDVMSGRTVLTNPGPWRKGRYGYVALTDGRPVACAAVFPIGGQLYVAFVATEPDCQRKGYAEAVVRFAVSQASIETGLRRIALHATEAGEPSYRRMGFRETAHFTVFSLEGAGN